MINVTMQIDDIKLFGMLDRCLSEMKYILDNPAAFDEATHQTMKHHIEDLNLFGGYAVKKLDKIKALPPVAEQRERGF